MQISRRTEQFQPASASYFVEPADQKLLFGITPVLGAPHLILKEPSLRVAPVDRPAFSFSLWLDAGGVNGNILWKPVSPLGLERAPCWGFSVSDTGRRLSFGAHDHGMASATVSHVEVDVPGAFARSGLHLENYVVSGTLLVVYQDGVERGRATLPRPVTDCDGNTVELGDLGLRIGEVAFFPKAISQFEVKEIFELGMPSYAIALGKSAVSVEPTSNEVAALDRQRFSELSRRQLITKDAQDQVRSVVANNIGVAKPSAATPAAPSDAVAPPPDLNAREPRTPCPGAIERDWQQPCSILSGVISRYSASPMPGFFDLLPTQGAVRVAQMWSYNITDFPRTLGNSWTWTFWARIKFKASPDTTEGLFILARVWGTSDQQPQESWSIYMSPDGAIGLKDATGSSQLGACLANPSRLEKIPRYADVLRFFAITVDGRAGKIQVFIDGEVAKACSVQPSRIAAADLALRPDTSISLGYMPLASVRTAVNTANLDASDERYAYIHLQQFRLYNGTVLNISDVAAIHTQATDPASNRPLRQCTLPSQKGLDSDWKDQNGNDCSWYAAIVGATPSVCDNDAVRAQCATTCSSVPCYVPTISSGAFLGSRVQRLDDPAKLVATCISSGRFMSTWRQYSQVFVPTTETVTVYLPQEYISAANYADLRIDRSKSVAADPCAYADDGKCDVPSLCPVGDWTDCFNGKPTLSLRCCAVS